ncbi:MAG: hypothetical protein WB973_05945 [Thermoanaerobaculia bacterium]
MLLRDMHLCITRHTEPNDPTGTTETTFRLKDGMREIRFPAYLGDAKLETLAERWFAIHGDGVKSDTNAAITRLGDITLNELLAGYKFSSPNPILIAATEERIKRAAWMLVEDAVYNRYVFKTQEQNIKISIDPSAAGPSGRPCPKRVRRYATTWPTTNSDRSITP